MAMEFIEGVELRSLIAEGSALPVPQAVSIAAQVAEGLAYAHEHGVVHRDIKPANIMVMPNGPVKITDFGIARMRASSTTCTQTGMMLGSPKYMSPEQVIGKRADHRSDIFSLGVILYEMLVRRGAVQRRERHRAHVPDRQLRAARAQRDEQRPCREMLDYIVAKMLAKPLDERYQGAHEVARDLRECERQLGVSVGRTQPRAHRAAAARRRARSRELVRTHAEAMVMAQTVNRTREDDATDRERRRRPPLARGVSHSFDSLEATQRLAVDLTGGRDAPPSSPKRRPQTQRRRRSAVDPAATPTRRLAPARLAAGGRRCACRGWWSRALILQAPRLAAGAQLSGRRSSPAWR